MTRRQGFAVCALFTGAALAFFCGILLGAAFGQTNNEIRVDTFDRQSNRTGYILINPVTGKVDTYDRYSNHTGRSELRPAPNQLRPGQPATLSPVPGAIRGGSKR